MLVQVIDYAPISTGQIDRYCINSNGGALKITLVWADYPADVSAAVSLVNDLDLVVAANSLNGYAQHGNGEVDRINNVEQVHPPAAETSELRTSPNVAMVALYG